MKVRQFQVWNPRSLILLRNNSATYQVRDSIFGTLTNHSIFTTNDFEKGRLFKSMKSYAPFPQSTCILGVLQQMPSSLCLWQSGYFCAWKWSSITGESVVLIRITAGWPAAAQRRLEDDTSGQLVFCFQLSFRLLRLDQIEAGRCSDL